MADGRKPTGRHPEKRLSPGLRAQGLEARPLLRRQRAVPEGRSLWRQALGAEARHPRAGNARSGWADARSSPSLKRGKVALENRKIARAGGDPLAQRRRTTAIPTFEDAAATVIDLHRHGWKNEKHAAQWGATLRGYVFPRLGPALPSRTSPRPTSMAVLMPIWNEKPETARRVRQRISAIMKWSVAQGYRGRQPGWRRHRCGAPQAQRQDKEPSSSSAACRGRSRHRDGA